MSHTLLDSDFTVLVCDDTVQKRLTLCGTNFHIHLHVMLYVHICNHVTSDIASKQRGNYFVYNSCKHPFLDKEFTEYLREIDQEICIRRDGTRRGHLRHLTSPVRYPALRMHAVPKAAGEIAGFGGIQIRSRHLQTK